MGIFSKKKKRGELVLVFDIGSSSVGGALFYIEESGVPNIIFSAREPIILEKKIEFDRFLTLTMRALEVIAVKVHTAGLGAPNRIFCVLSSPWYASQTREVFLEKNVPFIFNTKLADSLTQKEISLFKEEHISQLMGTSNEIRPIEIKNIKTMLNGYVTDSPINKKAKELKMSFFISMSPSKTLERIEETLGEYFHIKNIKFSSFVLASFTVARDIFIHQENFLLIDVSGEVTDISIIKKDILSESISYPLGRNFIIRGVASAFNCSLAQAKTFISLYKDGHAEAEIEKTLEPVIEKLKAQWLKAFQESLVNISNDISIPATIFITVDQDFANFFSETIKIEEFSQYTLTESKFRIIFLSTQALHGIALFNEGVTRDSFLTIEAIYISRFLH